MKQFWIAVAAVAVIVILGVVFISLHSQPLQTGGDFPGGQQPSTVVTCNVSGGYCSPVGSFGMQTSNGLWVGGTSQYNEQSEYVTASGTVPAAGLTLGPLGATTSTATTTLTLPNTAGLAVGAICSGGVATTTAFVGGCQLISTDGVTGTASVALNNFTGAPVTYPSTTVIRVTFDQLPY